jgi:hypothetical protein
MTHSDIRKIRDDVSGVCAALTAPDPGEIAAQMVGLEAAVRQLSEWERCGVQDAQEENALLRAELEALQQDLQRTERLIRSGDEFWRGWARLLGMDTGYTPSGMPGVIEATSRSRVEVEG